MTKSNHAKNEMLTIGDAAALLGVSVSTLRNWDRAKKLKARRHPINGYRLYNRGEVTALFEKINGKRSTTGSRGRR